MNIKNVHRLILIKSMNVMMTKTKIVTSINSGRVEYFKVDADVDDHDTVTMMINIATGETSQAITPFHFFDNFNFHH